jgi:hypothetical protein
VLDASASFTNFATEFLRTHKIDAEFEVTPEMLDQFPRLSVGSPDPARPRRVASGT